jgi:NlpC/P60 family putative phage cell wall peptidase
MQTVTRAEFLAELRTWIGTPYRHQGRLKGIGVDCVGLVIGAARECGIADVQVTGYDRRPDGTLLSRMLEHVSPVAFNEAQPGDVLLFQFATVAMHIGVLSAPDMLIHAYMPNRKVVEHRLDDAWLAKVAGAFQVPGVL